MLFSVLTLFPELFDSPLREGIIGRALRSGIIGIDLVNIRSFATDRHATTDDRPFGGGEGMVLKPEPMARAVRHVHSVSDPQAKVILLSPQGRRFDQTMATKLRNAQRLILVCGRYEGVDERFCDHYIDEEVSIGDYILTGGELAALVMIDTITRLIPGTLGCSSSADNDTFSRNLLKHPHFTRPRVFEGLTVPEPLLSGNHERIREYRFIASVKRTLLRRPELLAEAQFSEEELTLLARCGLRQSVEMHAAKKTTR